MLEVLKQRSIVFFLRWYGGNPQAFDGTHPFAGKPT